MFNRAQRHTGCGRPVRTDGSGFQQHDIFLDICSRKLHEATNQEL